MVDGIRIRFLRLASSELGAVATEYGLILTLISLAFLVAAGFFGDELVALFQGGADGVPSP
jgi:Flp pilus assembly pilin Flp